MSENFITKIYVKSSRNIKDFEIPLSENERKHLIITGKNGSGKTSLLNDLFKFLIGVNKGTYKGYLTGKENLRRTTQNYYTAQTRTTTNSPKAHFELLNDYEKSISSIRERIDSYKKVLFPYFKSEQKIIEQVMEGRFILTFFRAKRKSNLKVPTGIHKFELQKKYNINDKVNENFIQYIVNLKADRSFARDDGEMEAVKEIDEWFNRFESRLQKLFDSPELKLEFDRKNYTFNIIEKPDKEPFGFNTLSDGYSAIISIVSELLLRMEAHNQKAYDLQGVVLIDEIETHLHVHLQKTVLPFLIDFFPKIQFIVTTHSPFVLSSVSNAVICDLEKRTIIDQDLSAYSYDALVESYFETDKYSQEVKTKLARYAELAPKKDLNLEEKEELRVLKDYFAHRPKYLSKELEIQLQQIELQTLDVV